jgi:hypothetical protein
VEAGVFGLVDGDAGDGFGAEVGEEAGVAASIAPVRMASQRAALRSG